MSLLELDRARSHGATVADRAALSAVAGTTDVAGRWWRTLLAAGVAGAALLLLAGMVDGVLAERGSITWWLIAGAVHAPYALILAFLAGGLVERAGYFWRGRQPARPGPLPATLPTVCVQLPMYDEAAVAARAIAAACSLDWPIDRLQVQVLDDSTDRYARAAVETACRRMRADGFDCRVLHRDDRAGYKAGALEAGRRQTDAELIAIFDADFVPRPDFLRRAIAHFYLPDGRPDEGLALVQAQWGHLNADESPLTRAQSLWVDDHHTLQMSWRAAAWQFVNFTGTAGVWRASAIEHAGGWRASSLVEDCELSFRHLFAGYRTTFVKEVVVPAELPATYRAYKAQQRRWTRGWVQLQRLHLVRLLTRHACSPLRRLHLVYHMCISWQWPMWAVWTLLLPFAMATGLALGDASSAGAFALYLGPSVVWILLATIAASVETARTDDAPLASPTLRWRCARLLPYVAINTGMLPHQTAAFVEGWRGEMHAEFERTPKIGAVPAARPRTGSAAGRIARPYVLAEVGFVALQLGWAVLFVQRGVPVAALGALYLAACVAAVGIGSHAAERGPRRAT